MSEFWFKSTRFQVEPGEDKATSPFRFGRQVAHWLQAELQAEGYPGAEVIAEDWGWCVMCQRKPFRLWIGCGNVEVDTAEKSDDVLPDAGAIVWHLFVVSEPGLLQRLLNKAGTADATARLSSVVERLLKGEASITTVAEP
jgi:hypothetical protein